MIYTQSQYQRAIFNRNYRKHTRKVLGINCFETISQSDLSRIAIWISIFCNVPRPKLTYSNTAVYVCRLDTEGERAEFILNEDMLNKSDSVLDIIVGMIKVMRRLSLKKDGKRLSSELIKLDEDAFVLLFLEFYMEFPNIYDLYSNDLAYILDVEERVDQIHNSFLHRVLELEGLQVSIDE